jgi:hypothetical protein
MRPDFLERVHTQVPVQRWPWRGLWAGVQKMTIDNNTTGRGMVITAGWPIEASA